MTSIIDEFPKFFNTRKRQTIFRIAVCMMGFILGIPMVTQGGSHLLNLVDEAVLGFPLLLIGLFEYIVIIYLYGFNKFSQDINAMLGRNPFIYFKATWIVISPVLLLAVVVFKAYQMEDFHPGWVGLLYYLIVVFTMMWVPILYFHYSLKHGLWDIMKPKQSWINRRKLSELNKEDKTSEVNDKNTLFINEAPGDKDKLSYVNTAFDDDISKPHDLKDAEMGNGNVTGNGSLAKSADDRKDSANEFSRL
uniref:Uncharacterized protein n=1 Tax=Biomphalaria glabrata TaxID=6526 RepID=A0A2C9KN30_BIOGL